MREPQFDALCHRLGCSFQRKELLQLALAHRSVHSQENNERLEFLGDSILNFIIAEALYERFSQAKEGQLSRLRAELVSGVALAKLAKQFDLGDFLTLGPGELKSGGHRRASILADAFEAIIGALYLDQGMEVCRQHLLRWFHAALNAVHLDQAKDPKTCLQEKLQAYKLPLPIYDVVSVEGNPHDQHFHIMCCVPTISHETKGEGATRRRAEQQAAQDYLDWLATQNMKELLK